MSCDFLTIHSRARKKALDLCRSHGCLDQLGDQIEENEAMIFLCKSVGILNQYYSAACTDWSKFESAKDLVEFYKSAFEKFEARMNLEKIDAMLGIHEQQNLGLTE